MLDGQIRTTNTGNAEPRTRVVNKTEASHTFLRENGQESGNKGIIPQGSLKKAV